METPPDSPSSRVTSPPPRAEMNPYWKAVVATSFIFCGTTLAIVMTEFGDQQSPANQFLRKHGALLAAIEVGAVLASGFLAMSVDQRESRRALSLKPKPTPPQTQEGAHVGQDLRVE